jgi:hypothetical protein
LHEAVHLLVLLTDPSEGGLRAKWVADEGQWSYVTPGQGSGAVDRFEERVAQSAGARGLPPPARSAAERRALYDRLSRTAHNRRSSVINAVNAEIRTMDYGITTHPLRLAHAASWAAGAVTNTALHVGHSLQGFYGDGWLRQEILPRVEAITAVRRDNPLSEASLLRSAGFGS